MTVAEYLGKPASELYVDAPPIVHCTHCKMTFVLTPHSACDKDGFIFCSECAEYCVEE